MRNQLFISSKSDIKDNILNQLQNIFNLDTALSQRLYNTHIKEHFDQIEDGSYFVIETPYVDKVYRDSYYSYFSSKNRQYKRDSIRISIFKDVVSANDFRDNTKREELLKKYMGFIVLRPTEPNLIGRSTISPKILKTKHFEICTTNIRTTVNSIKLYIDGFPHSSQDAETISCAETTIWSLMEYFSNRYAEYKSELPSEIIQTLKRVSTERQIPSKGLDIQQISYALREFGLGTKIYSKTEYGDMFENLLSCYIESGIPLVIAMQNNTIGHALLCIGHEPPTSDQIDVLTNKNFTNPRLQGKYNSRNITVYDFNDLKEKYVFIDDNHPVYQTNFLESPSANYLPNYRGWANCKITYFIAPLYTKVYLEAFTAQNYIYQFLLTPRININDNSEILVKIFLTSNRSFKDWLATNNSFNNDVRDLILETAMPKFIWVAELSTKDLMKNRKANGIILLDATEANTMNNKPLIMASYKGNYISFAPNSTELQKFALLLGTFSVYQNNLKSFI